MNAATAFMSGALAVIAFSAPGQQATTPVKPLAVAWQFELEIDVDATRHVAAGLQAVVVTDSKAGVTARAHDDGRLLWQSKLLTAEQPVTAGTVVVFAVEDGAALQALEQSTGRDAWRVALDGSTAAGPVTLTATETLIFAIRGVDVRAFRPDGSTAWQRALPSAVVTAIVQSGNVLVAGLEQSALVALDPSTGVVRSTARLPARPTALSAAGDQVFVPTSEGELLAYRLSGANLNRKWRYRDRSIPAVGAPAIGERRVFYALTDNTVKAFNRSGGTKAWTAALESRPVAGPLLLGDNLVVPLAGGGVAQVPASDGKVTPKSKEDAPTAAVQVGAIAVSKDSVYAILTAGNVTTTIVAWRGAR